MIPLPVRAFLIIYDYTCRELLVTPECWLRFDRDDDEQQTSLLLYLKKSVINPITKIRESERAALAADGREPERAALAADG